MGKLGSLLRSEPTHAALAFLNVPLFLNHERGEYPEVGSLSLGRSSQKKQAANLLRQGADRTMWCQEDGFTLLEALIVVAIILILAAVAIPGALRSRQVVRRGVVITDLQTLHDELGAYEMMCGGYPPALPARGPIQIGCASSSTAGEDAAVSFVSDSTASGSDAASIVMSGYRFTYTRADLRDDGLYHGYTITADLIGSSKDDNESYFIDQTGVIRIHIGAETTASDPPVLQ